MTVAAAHPHDGVTLLMCNGAPPRFNTLISVTKKREVSLVRVRYFGENSIVGGAVESA